MTIKVAAFLAKVNGFIRILKCTKGLTLILSSPDVINRVANVKIGNIDDMFNFWNVFRRI